MEWIIGCLVGVVLVLALFGKWVKVEEGTAKIVIRLGAFRRVLLQWEGHTLDKEWNIVPGRGFRFRLLGGLQLAGIKYIDQIYKYNFRWSDIALEEGKEEVRHRERELDYILVRPHVYISILEEVETKDAVPTSTTWVWEIQVTNPYRALFIAPVNWLEKVQARVAPFLRIFVASCTYQELLGIGKTATNLVETIDTIKNEAEKIHQEWGIKIRWIRLREVETSQRYKEAAAKKAEMVFQAAGRAEKLMGTLIAAIARATGQPESEVQKAFLKDPKKFYKTHQQLIDNILDLLSMEEKAYLRIDTPGAQGIEGALLRLIALLKQPFQAPETPKPPQKPKKQSKPKPPLGGQGRHY